MSLLLNDDSHDSVRVRPGDNDGQVQPLLKRLFPVRYEPRRDGQSGRCVTSRPNKVHCASIGLVRQERGPLNGPESDQLQ